MPPNDSQPDDGRSHQDAPLTYDIVGCSYTKFGIVVCCILLVIASHENINFEVNQSRAGVG